MAPRKTMPASPVRKTAAKSAGERTLAAPLTTSNVSNPSRLLREAAWSRMFGRIESKNPFAR